MSGINRREFLFGVASMPALPIMLVSDIQAQQKPRFRFVLPDNQRTFAVGEIVPLRVFTKTQYPRLQVNFKANGQLVGTASSFPYQVNWVPSATGDYTLTTEVTAPQSSAIVATNVKVFNLLYDAIGRRGTRHYDVENHYSSYRQTAIPETAGYGLPLNYLANLNNPQTIRQIEVLISAVTGITNEPTNITFPQFHNIEARLWNNGDVGFRASPLFGNLFSGDLGLPNFGSTTVPLATNSIGIKYGSMVVKHIIEENF